MDSLSSFHHVSAYSNVASRDNFRSKGGCSSPCSISAKLRSRFEGNTTSSNFISPSSAKIEVFPKRYAATLRINTRDVLSNAITRHSFLGHFPFPLSITNDRCLSVEYACARVRIDGMLYGNEGHDDGHVSNFVHDTAPMFAQPIPSTSSDGLSSAGGKSNPKLSEPITFAERFWGSALRTASIVAAVMFLSSWLFPATSFASENSIGNSSLGFRLAEYLRRSGLSDELIVSAVAALPVLELRGAIPVGYWMNLSPVKTTIFSIIGNMLPVPLILLFLGPISKKVSETSEGAKCAIDKFFELTRKKSVPIEEFKWIGLMLFVAVPLPGTGAWSGAIASYILELPFWDSMTANFFGVIIASLAVNCLCCMPLVWAVPIIGAMILFSSLIWNVLRYFKSKF